MTLLLGLYLAGVLLELSFHMRFLWRARIGLASASILLNAAFAGAIVVWHFNLWSILIALICLYRIINGLRVLESRMHEGYMRVATRRTSSVFIGLQALLALCWWGWDAWGEAGHLAWGLIAVAQVAAALVLFLSLSRTLHRTRWPRKAPPVSDNDLPTITVAIPARNETEDLQACLQSLVTCDYPKLEIIVLDDCSQERRTPEIIRSFAHDGVRFIKGEEPKPTWLPKNQAYAHLAAEANGRYILFCGVDVRFKPDSLRQLAGLLLAKKKQMMCILPWRAAAAERRFALTQAMRYFWELVPPRRFLRRPPVLSTCWIIEKSALQQSGSFEAATRSVVPEAHFARQLIKTDAYSFMRATESAGVESMKPTIEQFRTATRMSYPQMHRRPENVFLFALAGVLFLLLPFVMLILELWISLGITAYLLTLCAAVLLGATYWRLVWATRTGSWWFGAFSLPVSTLFAIGIMHYSLYKFEFSEIDWKGRNVCIPAMHVIPRLPCI